MLKLLRLCWRLRGSNECTVLKVVCRRWRRRSSWIRRQVSAKVFLAIFPSCLHQQPPSPAYSYRVDVVRSTNTDPPPPPATRWNGLSSSSLLHYHTLPSEKEWRRSTISHFTSYRVGPSLELGFTNSFQRL